MTSDQKIDQIGTNARNNLQIFNLCVVFNTKSLVFGENINNEDKGIELGKKRTHNDKNNKESEQ
ncbi:hypothetical protein [Pseudoalteromonas sp. GB56]